MSDRAVVQIPVTLDAANRRKDRSVSLRFSWTQELGTADFAELDPAHTIKRLVPVRSERVDEGDIPADDAPDDGSVLRNACVPSYSFGGVRTPISQSRSNASTSGG